MSREIINRMYERSMDPEDPGLTTFFLSRLASITARHAEESSPTNRRILGQAAFSVYLDCLDLGLGAEARTITDTYKIEPNHPSNGQVLQDPMDDDFYANKFPPSM